jgi:predicted RNA-binding protein YlxR (DUF448 family)
VSAAPVRTCIACRRSRPKSELLRLAATPRGIRLDVRQRGEGRGAYLCPNPECLNATAHRGGKLVLRALRGGRMEQVQAALEQVRAQDLHEWPADESSLTHHEEHNA